MRPWSDAQKIEELEQAITAHDELIQKLEAKIQNLLEIFEVLEAAQDDAGQKSKTLFETARNNEAAFNCLEAINAELLRALKLSEIWVFLATKNPPPQAPMSAQHDLNVIREAIFKAEPPNTEVFRCGQMAAQQHERQRNESIAKAEAQK